MPPSPRLSARRTIAEVLDRDRQDERPEDQGEDAEDVRGRRRNRMVPGEALAKSVEGARPDVAEDDPEGADGEDGEVLPLRGRRKVRLLRPRRGGSRMPRRANEMGGASPRTRRNPSSTRRKSNAGGPSAYGRASGGGPGGEDRGDFRVLFPEESPHPRLDPLAERSILGVVAREPLLGDGPLADPDDDLGEPARDRRPRTSERRTGRRSSRRRAPSAEPPWRSPRRRGRPPSARGDGDTPRRPGRAWRE